MPLHQPQKVPYHGLERVARLARRILNLALDSVNASAAGEVPGPHLADPDGQFPSDRSDTCAAAPATGRRMNAGDGHCPQDRTYGPFGDEAARVRMRIRTRIVIAPAGLRSGATNRLLTSCSRRSRKARMTTPASPPAHRHRSRAPPCAAKQSIGRSARPGAARS